MACAQLPKQPLERPRAWRILGDARASAVVLRGLAGGGGAMRARRPPRVVTAWSWATALQLGEWGGGLEFRDTARHLCCGIDIDPRRDQPFHHRGKGSGSRDDEGSPSLLHVGGQSVPHHSPHARAVTHHRLRLAANVGGPKEASARSCSCDSFQHVNICPSYP